MEENNDHQDQPDIEPSAEAAARPQAERRAASIPISAIATAASASRPWRPRRAIRTSQEAGRSAGRSPDRPALRRVRGLAVGRRARTRSRSHRLTIDGRGQPRPSIVCGIVSCPRHTAAAALAGHFFLRDRRDRARECRANGEGADQSPIRGRHPGSSCLRRTSPTAIRSNAATSSRARRCPRTRSGSIWSIPRPGEDKVVERLLGIAVPTREEMQEIEVSSRLYVEHHARYMTATLMCNSDTATPKTTRGDLHPVRPSPRHRALRRSASVHDRRQQARPQLPGQRHRRNRAARPARRGDRPRRRHSGAHRHRGRSRLARHLRARRPPTSRCPTRTSSRRSAARAT